MSRVLVTGANGFVGSALSHYLTKKGFQLRAAVRSELSDTDETIAVGDINGETNWSKVLVGCQYIVHLAARVHVMSEHAENPEELYRQANTEGTRNLAKQASAAGVKRFIYLSTIKVNGECTTGTSFTAEDRPNPQDDYASSKLEAEQALIDVCADTDMEYVIIRPPLVYGPGVKANFLRLLKLVHSQIPLPLAAINNKRSLIALDNLVDFICHTITHEKAANETFLVSDGVDISTPQLVEKISIAFDLAPRLFSFPVSILNGLASVAGKQAAFERLQSSLQLDIVKSRELLEWQPPLSQDKAIKKTADWFINEVLS